MLENNQHDNAGNIYYIRLKTNLGVFYKIGYTTMNSVDERFSYGDSQDYKLIDKVLLFNYMDTAYHEENYLHNTLRLKAVFRDNNDKRFPLYKNGQSELYYDDVLGLDTGYDYNAAAQTRRRVKKIKRQIILGYLKNTDELLPLLGGLFVIFWLAPVWIPYVSIMYLYSRVKVVKAINKRIPKAADDIMETLGSKSFNGQSSTNHNQGAMDIESTITKWKLDKL